MEIVNFPKIGIGEFFVVDGEKFKKHSELVFVDTAGIERYIDPLFDRKLGKELAAQMPAPAVVPPPFVDAETGGIKAEKVDEFDIPEKE